MCRKFQSESLEGGDNLEYLSINGKVILKQFLKKQDVKMTAGFVWHRIGPTGWAFVNMVINLQVL
jgi:hypothetical protein